MTDDAKCYAATPAATLEQHITDSNVPKNEAEWWAYHEITRLREENARLREALKPFGEALKDNYYHQIDAFPIVAGSNQIDIRFKWTLGELPAAAAAIREGGE